MKICNNCKKELPQFPINLSYVEKHLIFENKFIIKEFCSKECLFDDVINKSTITMKIMKVEEKNKE
jgi:hypothetical protein